MTTWRLPGSCSRSVMAVLLAVGLVRCVHTLRPEEWNTTFPAGDCEVEVTNASERHPHTVLQYAKDGRLLSSSHNNGYNEIWKKFHYAPDGRLIATSRYEQTGVTGVTCTSYSTRDIEGFCYAPTRITAQGRWSYNQDGRLIGVDSTILYYQQYEDEYRLYGHVRGKRRYEYDKKGRRTMHEYTNSSHGGTGKTNTEYTADGGIHQTRFLQSWATGKPILFSAEKRTTQDEQGRVTAIQAYICSSDSKCRETERYQYSYDEASHLIKRAHILEDPKPGHDSENHNEWDYDEKGHVLRETKYSVLDGRPLDRRVFEYAYDDTGHDTAWYAHGELVQRKYYKGDCSQVHDEQPAPSAMTDLGLDEPRPQ